MYWFIAPFIVYLVALDALFRDFSKIISGESMWVIYVLMFPFLIIIFPFILKKYLRSVPLVVFPIIIFIVLQVIPLPRSALIVKPQQYSPNLGGVKHEPYAIGLGYPFSNAKLFQGYGCLNGYGIEAGGRIICGKLSEDSVDAEILPDTSKTLIMPGDYMMVMSAEGIVAATEFFIYSYVLFLIICYFKAKRSGKSHGNTKSKSSARSSKKSSTMFGIMKE